MSVHPLVLGGLCRFRIARRPQTQRQPSGRWSGGENLPPLLGRPAAPSRVPGRSGESRPLPHCPAFTAPRTNEMRKCRIIP
jgi:hypothetical protein